MRNFTGLTTEPDAGGAYEQHFAQSRRLYGRAQKVLAGGTNHDSRNLEPFPVYISHAEGAVKWDVSGHQLIDYWMGHGSLLFGHSFAPVLEAIVHQASRGTHYGAGHELEVRWAELVCDLIPSAERVRFTSSGTEATMLALRTARSYTGRYIVLKLDGNFHGWHDEAMSHFVPTEESGLSPGSAEYVGLADPLSIEAVVEFLDEYEVAAVILEPGGGGSGALPWDAKFLEQLRQATSEHGCMLIFDEVVSAFRYSPGGVQQLCGVKPDITVLAKILSGGLPGGAIAGREEVMDVFGKGVHLGERQARVPHTGTFNANPLSAAAGIAMLEHVGGGDVQDAVRIATENLAELVNHAAEANNVDVHVYTNSSTYHILIGAKAAGATLGASSDIVGLFSKNQQCYVQLRRALLLEGVDTHPTHGWLSVEHQPEVIQATAAAFERAFKQLRGVQGFAL